MADGKDVTTVETSVVNPKQEVNAMENLDKVTSYTTPTYTLETNPTQFKQEKNKSFFDSEAWKDYKSNLLRAYSNEYPGFTSIEKVAENDLWRDSLGANSDFVVKRAQAIHNTYAYATGWWGKLAEAYNAQRFGLRAAAARKDLSDAIHEGDELKIAEAKIKYEQEKRRVYERGNPYEEYGNTLMSLAASAGRNPETIPINFAGWFFAPVTGGVSVGASQLINAGIVGADTYRLETGAGLEQLDELDTDLTEEQKFEKAKVSGLTNALVESGMFAIGGNLAARGTRSIGKAAARYATTKAAQKLAGAEITKEASKSLLKTEFIKALQNPVEKKTIKQILAQYGKDSLFGGLSEGAQEVFQDSMTDAMLRSVQSGKEISEELLEDWADFIVDPFSERHAQKWETFTAVALASPIFAAGFSGVGAGIEIARTGQVKKGMGNAVDKLKGAMNNNLGLSRLFAIQGEADAKNGTPVSNAVLQEQIRRGEVSGKLYTTVEQVEQMQQDPEVAEALEQMGVAKALENASENGGVVELDFAAYDKIVNESQNQVLFQKMRNYLSFSETTMSIEEYNQFIRDSGKQVATSLAEEIRNDVNSIYNKAKEMFIKAGMEQGEAEGNAAIIHTALTNAKGLTQDKQNDILDRVRVTIEGKEGGNITQKFNEAMAGSEVTPDGSRIVNMGDKKQTAISFNKVAEGKDKGKYTVGIKDNTGLSSVMKDTGGWSAPEEQNVTPAVFETEVEAQEAVRTMYAKTDGDGVTLDVGAAFNEVFAENLEDGTVYDGDTINIDGKERSVYNSNGDRIANSEKALRAFYKWFGDSKVVDEQGRPLVVYHGAKENKFESFDLGKMGINGSSEGMGIYFTPNQDIASDYGETRPMYLRLQNPMYAYSALPLLDEYGDYVTEEEYTSVLENKIRSVISKLNDKGYTFYPDIEKGLLSALWANAYPQTQEVFDGLLDTKYYLVEDVDKSKFYEDVRRATVEEFGVDGYYTKKYGNLSVPVYVAWLPTQIKSTDNRGTFDINDVNVYHMMVGTGADTTVLPQGLQDRIQKAKDMMAEGKSDEEVFEETRLHIAPDGKLRIQISDVDGQLTEDSDRYISWDSRGHLHGRNCYLEDIFDHELLFDLYPGLRKLPVRFKGSGSFHSSLGYINLGSSNTKGRIRQTILHEVQHAIQDMEEWAHGGTYTDYTGKNKDYWARQDIINKKIAPKLVANKVITYWAASEGGDSSNSMYNRLGSADEMRALMDSPAVQEIAEKDEEFAKDLEEVKALNKKLEKFDANLSYIKYYRLFGEAESRLTERLSYKTQEQLDALDPYEYFDVEKLLVTSRYKGPIDAVIEAPKNKQKTGEFNVVFDAEAGRSIIDGTLVEAGRTVARNGQYDIILTPNANATTFAHEVFHMFSLELQRVYNNGTISDYWKKQADKMFKLAEAEPQVDPVDPTVVRYNLTEAQEERLANMFTTYIMKGKIENYEVRGMLAKLIEMFKTVYQQAESRDLTEKALNKKAYDFFNTVISSQETIEEIQRNAGLLEIAEPEGVDRELYDYYIANLAISKVEASDDLRKKLFAIDAFKKSAEYTKLLQQYKDQATEELVDTTRYKVVAQASLFGEADKVEKTTLWAQNEFPELNLTEGDIADILNNTKPLEQAATEQANEEMDDYIAQQYKISRDELGFKEERNRAKVRALLAEAVMRRGGTLKDIDEEIKKAENASDKHLAKISVYQILDLGKWKNREAATVQRYTWAKHNDREDLMSAERFNQAVVNLIMIKANGFKSEYQKITTLFERLQDRQKQYRRKDEHGDYYGPMEHRYHADDWELLRSISENFGNKIRDKRRSPKTVHQQMKEWIETQVENRFTAVAGLEEYIPFVDKGHDGSVGSMKGKDFKKLWVVIGTINGIAMREQQLFLDGQYEELAGYVKQTVDFFNEMNIDTEGKTFLGTSGEFLGKYGTWTNPEPLARAIFPPEVFRKIFLPMFQGATKSEAVAKEWIDEWNAAKKNINTSTQEFVLDDGTRITYGVETQKVMTYGDVANLLIAMGAEHSYENYKLKFGLTDEQAKQIASQAIKRNPAYVDFMNKTWEVYGKATVLLNDSFKERNNELFVEKQHRAFEIDGIKFEGGYVPEDKHYQALVRELGTWNQGNDLHRKKKWKNEEILTKAADGDVLSIIDITEMKLSQSAKWIYAATPYNNIKKFLEDKTIGDTIGDRIFAFFKDWLQNWDTPHFDESGMWRPLSRMTTLSALSMRASTALLQLSGLVQATTMLKPVYVARGMLQFIRENGFFRPFKIQETKSLYMASRVANPFANKMGMDIDGATFKEMFDKYNRKSALGKVGAALLTAYQRIGMSMIQLVDGWVATITWNGAYARAKDNGLSDEEAKLEADSVVRITQSDAMQISRSSAMQEPWARAVTAFGTWTMGMRSQTQALSTSKNYRLEYVAWTLSWVVVASLIEAYLKDLTEPSDDDDDKETLERVRKSWYNKIVEAVGTQALPFGGIGSTAAKTIAYALEPEDDEHIFEVFAGGNVSALQYAYRMAESTAKLIDYMQTGEEEQRDKFFITASGLVSNNIKKHVKKALED